MKKSDCVKDVLEILDSHCEIASEELRKQGQALVSIADALEGQSNSDARAIMKSVECIIDIQKPRTDEDGG
jgi:hypothetical protein